MSGIPPRDTPATQSPLSVSGLTALIKQTLEDTFPAVWVVGEITDLARPPSGHVYLTLKDERAQIRAVMWRSTASRLNWELADGQLVVCRGDLDVYPPRGVYQLVIRQIEPQGEGALQQRLRQLHQRLAAEGLFDTRHKRPLPRFPRRIGLVTSPTGAAVRDFLEVVRRRWRPVHVLVLPTRVQGEQAVPEIVRAIQVGTRLRPRLDALVVTRGGGSIEDLWCFNDEAVVRAVFAATIPVISAIGHEIDVTLCDLVADQRALTPTEAAERLVPSAADVRGLLTQLQQRAQRRCEARLQTARARVDALRARRVLQRPWESIRQRERSLDEWHGRAQRAIRNRLHQLRQRVAVVAGRLQTLSPLAVLGRGYSITQRVADQTLVTHADTLQPGDRIRTRFATGSRVSRVEEAVDEPALTEFGGVPNINAEP